MDDSIRVSDADRDRVAAHLREHFAQGRITADELDDRLTATLSARTFGDLGGALADLPEPATIAADAGPFRPQAAGAGTGPAHRPPAWPAFRRGPRILPLALIVLIAAVAIPGAGWLLGALIKAIVVFWLVACLMGMFVANRFRRRLRRAWWSGHHQPLGTGWPGAPARPWDQSWHQHQHPHPGGQQSAPWERVTWRAPSSRER